VTNAQISEHTSSSPGSEIMALVVAVVAVVGVAAAV
jgi:hypothetical protein